MKQKYYKGIILAGIGLMIILFFTFRMINQSMENQFNKQIHQKKNQVSLVDVHSVAQQAAAKAESQLAPDNPMKYNIPEQHQSVLLENQQRWDSVTKKIIDQSDVIHHMSSGEVFKGVKKTPEQFQKQLQRIDGRIREYRKRVQSNPGDEGARRKLRDLYMLRSTVSGLEDAVVEK